MNVCWFSIEGFTYCFSNGAINAPSTKAIACALWRPPPSEVLEGGTYCWDSTSNF